MKGCEPVKDTEILMETSPQRETEFPSAETETPSAETETPSAETETPSAETESPSAETESPQREIEFPSAETESPTCKDSEMPPPPDFIALSEAGEEAVRGAAEGYAAAVQGYIERQVESRIAPIIAEHREKIEGAAVKERMAKSPEYEGFSDNLERIESIIEKIKLLKSLPPEERYTLAYLIDRGQRAAGRQTPVGAALVDALFADKEALEILERRRLAEYERGAELPLLPPAHRRAAMPANLPKKPKNIEQAGGGKEDFGL